MLLRLFRINQFLQSGEKKDNGFIRRLLILADGNVDMVPGLQGYNHSWFKMNLYDNICFLIYKILFS